MKTRFYIFISILILTNLPLENQAQSNAKVSGSSKIVNCPVVSTTPYALYPSSNGGMYYVSVESNYCSNYSLSTSSYWISARAELGEEMYSKNSNKPQKLIAIPDEPPIGDPVYSTIIVSVSANSGITARTGYVNIGGHQLRVYQSGSNAIPGSAGNITSNSNSVKPGQSGVVYSVPKINNATGYIWLLPPGATIASGQNTSTITVNYSSLASPGNVTVRGKNVNGVGPTSPSLYVDVVIPEPTLLSRGPNIWSLACTIMDANEYFWYYNNTLVPNSSTLKYQYYPGSNMGTYSVEIKKDYLVYLESEPVTIPINPAHQTISNDPNKVDIYVVGPTVWLFATAIMDAYEYLWFCDGVPVPNSNKNQFAPGKNSGTYYARITVRIPYYKRSKDIVIPTPSAISLESENQSDMKKLSQTEESVSDYKLYPNPNRGIFSIKSNTQNKISKIDIYDNSGKLVYQTNNYNFGNSITIPEGIKGVLIVKISDTHKTYTQKLVVE